MRNSEPDVAEFEDFLASLARRIPYAPPPQYRQALDAAAAAAALLDEASTVPWVSVAADVMRDELAAAAAMVRSVQDAIGRAMSTAYARYHQFQGGGHD